jgi:gamma-glutamyltranspeptidase/glutathione hydrolase
MRPLAVLLLATTAVTGARAGEGPRPVVGRSMVATRYGIVAASQPLAARAGTLMLERGGNAVDAALATAITLTVVEPCSNGIGSDLFAILWD